MPRAPAAPEAVARRRDEILDAATAVIAERGWGDATVRRIAARAGVAEGTIYNYFAGKDDLLLGLLERLHAAETRKVPLGAHPPSDFVAFLSAYMRHRLGSLRQDLDLLRALLPALLADARLRARYAERILTPSLRSAEQLLVRAMASGRARSLDPALCARALSGLVLGALVLELLGDDAGAARHEQLPELLGDLLAGGLAAR